MRKIIVQEFVSLDGVMQAPGEPDEDTSNGFKFGGWTAPYFNGFDQATAGFMKKWMKSTDILLGRKTFDIFAAYWPTHEEIWPGINDVTKYVMSSTITENKTAWKNCVFINSIDDIKKLKNTEGSEIKVHGSSKLAQTLFEHDLVDELVLQTFPVILGAGKRLFSEASVPAAYTLTDSLVTTNGVIYANYKRAGEVKTGTVGG